MLSARGIRKNLRNHPLVAGGLFFVAAVGVVAAFARDIDQLATIARKWGISAPSSQATTIFGAKAVLSISGTGAEVDIRVAPSGIQYEGGEVSGTGQKVVAYVPVGQRISLNVSGTGVQVSVKSELMPYIDIRNSGTGTNIVEY